ncbi:MAG: dTDP-4-dehydrorhamnose reductase [Nitrospirota bacterium]
MKILVTGSNGMLGQDLIPILKENHEAIPFPKYKLDITKIDSAHKAVLETNPDLVINCAAYTNVDGAENETYKAFSVNGTGVQNLALACEEMGIPICHISTDYVFDGGKRTPYTPFDNTNPINRYGESKLAGEKYIQWITNRFYIIRTSWLYGKGGKNFVSTIRRTLKEQSVVRVVHDQTGSPTSTVMLSHAIKSLIETGAYGIYHYTDETDGGISWYDFARAVADYTGSDTELVPITTEEFPRPAKRPAYSVLDTGIFYMVTGQEPVGWKEPLKDYLKLSIA